MLRLEAKDDLKDNKRERVEINDEGMKMSWERSLFMDLMGMFRRDTSLNH